MKIIIAPDSFKGSLRATEAARAMAEGIRLVFPDAQLIEVPIADGGEGTVEAFLQACGGSLQQTTVQGPLGAPVQAAWGLLPDNTAIVEIAAAAGLCLLPADQQDPKKATTEGVGQLIKAILDAGIRRIIIGLGGSGTNDGGSGMLRALGAGFFDVQGRELLPGFLSFINLAKIDISHLDPRLQEVDILVASDVVNPLCGPDGCSTVFGPQKGVKPEEIQIFDKAMARYAEIASTTTGRNAAVLPGAGAAGGLGAALLFFTGAKIRPGIEVVLESVHFDDLLAQTDLVVTGEGRTDMQTLRGKVPMGVARCARTRGVPVLCISGSVAAGAEQLYDEGVNALFSCAPGPISLADSLQQAEVLVRQATERAFRLVKLGMAMR